MTRDKKYFMVGEVCNFHLLYPFCVWFRPVLESSISHLRLTWRVVAVWSSSFLDGIGINGDGRSPLAPRAGRAPQCYRKPVKEPRGAVRVTIGPRLPIPTSPTVKMWRLTVSMRISLPPLTSLK